MIKQNSAYFIAAALSFSVYIYADFSSYSDMARGIAKILGIEIGKNFNNPYLSVSCSEFWRRWHVSLNEWLTENVYISSWWKQKGQNTKICECFSCIFNKWNLAWSLMEFCSMGSCEWNIRYIGQLLITVKKRAYAAIKVD